MKMKKCRLVYASLGLILAGIHTGDGFAPSILRKTQLLLNLSVRNHEEGDAANCESSVPANVKIDSSGQADLSNRFKYKVNALMGTFDPSDGRPDTERTDGNILGALVNFPANHTFTVVGRTGDDRQTFVNDVQCAVVDGTRRPLTELETQVTERGTKFTKVSVTVQVDSADMVSQVHVSCSQLEGTVMQF